MFSDNIGQNLEVKWISPLVPCLFCHRTSALIYTVVFIILSLLAMFGKVGRCIISLHHDRLILLDALSFKSRLLFHVDLSTLLRVVLKITVSDYNFLCSASSSSCSQLSVQHLKIHKFKTNCFVIIRKITKAI